MGPSRRICGPKLAVCLLGLGAALVELRQADFVGPTVLRLQMRCFRILLFLVVDREVSCGSMGEFEAGKVATPHSVRAGGAIVFGMVSD